ncbi:recombination-related endonuclease [Erwinia phage vB_EamM-Bue1]|uniref:Recombination-related endonuclease n=1 Tax=Erwinia phage vB_EamM-Bue1 TaxID=2099338 RepID=A0A2P1JUA0_9CAUD|nr:recombination-related endonuclease [Erwinia phage vB_EamM-Bue1]AVO22924.1 recombination-related endonuclease [Erwinia phage vB_EamM-Bue1]
MAIAKLGDLHIGSRQGSQFLRDFIKSYLIDYFIPEIVENEIKTVWQFGDFFDVRKFLYGADKHWIEYELVPVLRANGIRWFGLVGNHDISLSESNRLNWPSWLNSIAPDVFCYVSEPTTFIVEGKQVLVLPWINKENYDICVGAIQHSQAEYCFSHLELAGFKMYQSSVCDHGQIDPALLSKFKRVDTGHFHTRSFEDNIQYLGTPYHLTWEDYKDGDNRGFFIDDLTDGGELFIKNDKNQTLFRVIEYAFDKMGADVIDKWKDPAWLQDELGLKGQIIKIVVNNRDNLKHYEAFCDAMKRVQCIDYNYIDNTVTVAGEKVTITEEMITTDAIEIFKADINASQNIQRKDRVCKLAEFFYTSAQNKISVGS